MDEGNESQIRDERSEATTQANIGLIPESNDCASINTYGGDIITAH